VTAQQRWDVFCRVVDHFGDVGVSWRLARQLAAEHPVKVRLWVDDLHTFHRIEAAVDPSVPVQAVGGVEVQRWDDLAEFSAPAEVVIEAFGSRVPAAYLDAMAAQPRAPVWINLEYLSAESWVEGCHGVASPHPTLPLVKHFFFPGFTAATGGLLRERHLESRRVAELAQRPARVGEVCTVSLFGYGGPAVGGLLGTWAHGNQPMLALVPESRLLADVASFLGRDALGPGDREQRGALTVLVLPFQDQDGYDRLLWRCDCNFVRGEDSFMRAQWARRPLVWNIYAQEGGAHWAKLHAFQTRYSETLDEETAAALREFWRLWNLSSPSPTALATGWHRFWACREALALHAERWAAALQAQTDLTTNLVTFARERL
jgi:uncharacterized repeat protein (TIGR03837 family)